MCVKLSMTTGREPRRPRKPRFTIFVFSQSVVVGKSGGNPFAMCWLLWRTSLLIYLRMWRTQLSSMWNEKVRRGGH